MCINKMKRRIFPYDALITAGIEICFFAFVIQKKAKEFENLDENVGFWTPHTANVDWCEENYNMSYFVAEFVNTCTNVPVILACIWALKNWCNRSSILTFSIIALIWVASSSLLFHCTLKRIPQLMDQISMLIFLIPLMFFFERQFLTRKQRDKLNFILFFFMLASVVFMVFIPSCGWIFHVSFVSFLLIVVGGALQTFRRYSHDENMVLLYKHGIWSAIVAGAFWVLDRGYCGVLPCNIHAHALWHLCIFYSAFQILQVVSYLSTENLTLQYIFQFFPLLKQTTHHN